MLAGRSAILILSLTLVGVSARAQDLPSPEVITIDLGPYLHPGRQIRISGEAMRRLSGPVLNLHPDTIFIATGNSADGRAIPLKQVDTLWTKGNMFVPGLGLGTGLGFTVGGAICIFKSQEGCKALPYTAVAGFVLGGVFGKLKTIWTRRYSRRDGGPQPVIGPWLERR